MIPIEDPSIRSVYLLEISGRPRLGQREFLPRVVARAKRKIIDHFRFKAEETKKLDKMTKVAMLFLLLCSSGFAQSPANTATITNTSGVQQCSRPVSISRPFRQGEIQQYARAAVDGAPVLTQCDVKNRWPDGSLKFAVVSFVVPCLGSGSTANVSFSNQTSGNNTPLTQGQMLEAAFNFDVDLQMTGTSVQAVSARDMLAAGAWSYWLKGPIVTAVIIEDRAGRTYDKDFGDGSKALHPIFESWFYPAGNKVEIGATVENVWASSVATGSMRDLSYSLNITSGVSSPGVEYTHPAFIHIGKSRWHKRFWIGNPPPSIRINHNPAYLTSTGALPNWDASIVPAESLLASKYSTWNALSADRKSIDGDSVGIGLYRKALNTGGATDWLGLMNTWDVLYVLSQDDRMKQLTLEHADLAGRIPIHYREADQQAGLGDYFDGVSVPTQGRVVSINARKTVGFFSLTTNCGSQYEGNKINVGAVTTGGWNQTDPTHFPELAYLAYLSTGRYYYLEELQMEAAYWIGYDVGCYAPAYNRQGENGYFYDSELRGTAWSYRTTAYAAFLSPDGEPEKAYFTDKLKNNIALLEGEFDIPNSYPEKAFQYNWGKANRYQGSPLGVLWNRGPSFIQAPLRTDGFLSGGASVYEENYLLCSVGLSRQFGFAADNILTYGSKQKLNIFSNPQASKYLIEAYRNPAKLANGSWVGDWATYKASYATVPNAWVTGMNADHGYGFIALGTTSFMTPYTVDGYSGAQVWQQFKSEYPGQDRFATESPKWAILPLLPPDTQPPTVPANLNILTLNLGWDASTDNVGVVGYKVFKNGVELGDSASPNFSISNLTTGNYSFKVVAYDAAGNLAETPVLTVMVP